MNAPEPKLAKSAGAPDSVLYVELEFLPPYLLDSDRVSAPPFDAVSFSLGVLSPFDIPTEASTQDKSEG